MNCQPYFNRFFKNISLDKNSFERIDKEMDKLRDFVLSDSVSITKEIGIKDVVLEMFIQGSIALDTCLKPPTREEEFDVDVILLLSLELGGGELPLPNIVLKWLQNRLQKSEFYKERFELFPRCVRINFKGDFHMDIVPMVPKHNDEEILLIPDRKLEEWLETNPKGYIKWFKNKNIEKNDELRKIVMYLKWWRKVKAPKRADVCSIIFTTLLGQFNKDGNSDAETLVNTMENANDYLKRKNKTPKIFNPSLNKENFSDNWSLTEYKSFKTHFNKATITARAALDEQDEYKCVLLWREIFGDAFPKPPDSLKNKEKKGKFKVPSPPRRRSNREFGE